MHRRLSGSFQVLVAMLLVLLMAAGCSRISLVYRNLDMVLPWRVDDYVGLNRDQSRYMDAQLEQLIAWHCSARLPEYVQRLDQLKYEPVSYQAVSERYAWGRQEIDRIWSEATPPIHTILADLSAAQVQGLSRALQDKRRERYEEYVEPSVDEQIEERAERMRDRVEDWMGRLSDTQRERIEAWARQLGDVNAEWLNNRARWDRAFVAALAERQSPAFAERLAHLFQNRRSYWTDEFRQRFERNEEATLQLLVDLYALASEEQRQHLMRQLTELRRDLAELACTSQAKAG